jgi:hypothetical protein
MKAKKQFHRAASSAQITAASWLVNRGIAASSRDDVGMEA